MDRDREPGATFDLRRIGWIDFESRGPTPFDAVIVNV